MSLVYWYKNIDLARKIYQTKQGYSGVTEKKAQFCHSTEKGHAWKESGVMAQEQWGGSRLSFAR